MPAAEPQDPADSSQTKDAANDAASSLGDVMLRVSERFERAADVIHRDLLDIRTLVDPTIRGMQHELDVRISALERTQVGLDASPQNQQLSQYLDQRFTSLERRHDVLDQTIHGLNGSIASLNTAVTDLRSSTSDSIASLNTAVTDLRTSTSDSIASLNTSVAELRVSTTGAIGSLSSTIAEFRSSTNEAIASLSSAVASLGAAVVDLRVAVSRLDAQMEQIDRRIDAGFWRNAAIAGTAAGTITTAIVAIIVALG
jgi:uncharacterized coiled-coil protein SlyX